MYYKVNHLLLICKLRMLGFTVSAINWIPSYFLNRTQRVYFNYTLSKSIHAKSGVPQGSHLGPLLFSLFINDLPQVVRFSNILMYADDVKIFFSHNQPFDQLRLQMDLDSFYVWCNVNLMELNIKKCKLMRFARNIPTPTNYFLGSFQVDTVDTFLDLGILFDPKLTFISHITCRYYQQSKGYTWFYKALVKRV